VDYAPKACGSCYLFELMTANHTLTSISLPQCSLSVPVLLFMPTSQPIVPYSLVQWLAVPQTYRLDSHVGAVQYTRGVEKQTEI
jgi:hypothetical protein